jgi:hypothetical protein
MDRLLALALLLLPTLAHACPACLGQRRDLTPTLKLLGLLMAVPFAIAFVVARIIRNAPRDP